MGERAEEGRKLHGKKCKVVGRAEEGRKLCMVKRVGQGKRKGRGRKKTADKKGKVVGGQMKVENSA